MSLVQRFLMPDLGEGLTEGTVIEWLVSEGDTIELNQPLVVVETAKASVELPSPYSGTVRTLFVAQDQTVDVGTVLVDVADPNSPDDQEHPQTRETDTSSDDGSTMLVGSGPHLDFAVRRRRPRPAAAASPETIVAAAQPESSGYATSRIHADSLRRGTAARMVRAMREIPQAGTWTTVNVTPTLEFVQDANSRAAPESRMNILTVIAAAMTRALVEQPIMNSSWDSDTDDILLHSDVNLGIATASPRGMLVPNVKRTQTMSLPALGGAIRELVEKARRGECTPTDVTRGTATITNIGAKANVGAGVPMLNPPECVILAVGRVNRRPWVAAEQLIIADLLEISFSIDHRIVDGVQPATFLESIANYVGDPSTLVKAMEATPTSELES
jgi:2-oxoisovalerate dehydrogenase E2 component (dihydrolipoyl transacylase)